MSSTQQLYDAIKEKNNGQISELLGRMDVEAVNGTDRGGWTPLHYACYYNSSQAVQLLLPTPGIDINATDSDGITPIMCSAACCSSEALQRMLQDTRVDLEVRGNDGQGLEAMVGVCGGNAMEKRYCLMKIQVEKSRRENRREEQKEESHQDIQGKAGEDLEEVRASVRVQYIQKIDEVNQQIRDREQSLGQKLEIRNIRMKELKDKQDFEKKTFDMNLNEGKMKLSEKKAKLEQEMANIQQNMATMEQQGIRDNEEMALRHANEKQKLKEDLKEEQQKLANLKETADQLATDLGKMDLERGNDAYLKDHEKLEAAREILECPVCLDIMRPPTRIWQCPSSHIICEACKDRVDGRICPTCRTERISQRAYIVEQIARTMFNE